MTATVADHDLQPRHRRHQSFLQESKLPVPKQAEPRKDRREEHGHPDDAGRHELKVAAPAGALEDRPQPEPQSQ
jgi:hypothetical protein